MTTEEYRTSSGRVLVITHGLGARHYMTCERKPNGALRRISSPYLPLRDTHAEALADFWRWVGLRMSGNIKERNEMRPIYWHYIQEIQASWPEDERSVVPEQYRIKVQS